MRIKLDENLPASLANSLEALGHSVDTVRAEGLVGRPDSDVRQAAQASARVLVTQDLDFSDIRKFRQGTHHSLVLIRLRLLGRLALVSRLLQVFRSLG